MALHVATDLEQRLKNDLGFQSYLKAIEKTRHETPSEKLSLTKFDLMTMLNGPEASLIRFFHHRIYDKEKIE